MRAYRREHPTNTTAIQRNHEQKETARFHKENVADASYIGMNKQSFATMCGICLLLLLLSVGQALAKPHTPPPQEKELTELWTGSIFTSKFRCGFCFTKNGKARGVLLLKTAFGQVDEYHLYGTMKNGHLDVRHSSGHHVRGHIVDHRHVKGSIRLGTGRSFSFSGKRQVNVRLKSADCAPLPE